MSKRQPIKILHITPHLGTGVGTVLLNYLSMASKNPDFEHKVICLDYANSNSIEVSKKVGFALMGDMSKNIPEILQMISKADIVLVHWWNHPLLYDFLVRQKLPACRIIFWSHVLGSAVPNHFTDKLLKYPDVFAFTTPVSFKTKAVQGLPAKFKKRMRTVWSTGGMERIKYVKPKRHKGFNIGYIGTVDYTKMHPDFLKMSSAANIPGAKFIVIGGPNSQTLQKETEKLGLADKFIFTGFISEEQKWRLLSTFDIFGYPLAPHHYGSSDQALQEAMGAGAVPVIFANPMESYMVKNGKTGIVVRSSSDYAKALEKLHRHKNLREHLSKNVREYARYEFSLKKMTDAWRKLFRETLKSPKQEREWQMSVTGKKITVKDVFLESLGSYGKPFIGYCKAKNVKEKKLAEEKIKKLAELPNWRSKSKGTVHQYNTFFPNDRYVSTWSQLMDNS